jgi:NAD-dependent SIR2 family protein deacetylase
MQHFQTIKEWLENADAIVISTGAGMGVDSGLETYRGEEGKWGKVEEEVGKSIFETVNPQQLMENPQYGWTLFAKRMQEFNNANPHQGFYILKNWIEKYQLDYFILTSNIDSHFQKAGFEEDKIRELHGSLAYFQSTEPESNPEIWKNEITPKEILANIDKGIYPTCPNSTLLARPNVYMFRDDTYINTRTKQQDKEFKDFLNRNQNKNILVIEIGSGPHVQSIRAKTRMLKSDFNAKIIRINPKDFTIKPPHIGIAKGALEALNEINEFLK